MVVENGVVKENIKANGIGMTNKNVNGQFRNSSMYAVVVTVATNSPAHPVAKAPLSAREIEILTVASHGKTAQEMSASLAITERTVAFHVNNIVEKLGASNKTHAVALALRQGLIE